jgi:hypothetical protein
VSLPTAARVRVIPRILAWCRAAIPVKIFAVQPCGTDAHRDCMTEGLNEALDLLERTAQSLRRT